MANEIMNIDPMTGEIIPQSQMVGIEESRATAETQAGFIVAQRFPRNTTRALNRILDMCRREGLAEQAAFSFKKGGTVVAGATIRLAEAVAQQWGNMQNGIRELEELDDATVMMAYSYDLESNLREERIFTVAHHIKLKSGQMKHIDDPRELYELKFNMGQRRKRVCITSVIPGDVMDMALETCKKTMAEGKYAPTEENISRMLEKFAKVGVTKEMIEARQGKNIDALTGPEMVTLRMIFVSIRDGIRRRRSGSPKTSWSHSAKQKRRTRRRPRPRRKHLRRKRQPSPRQSQNPRPRPQETPRSRPGTRATQAHKSPGRSPQRRHPCPWRRKQRRSPPIPP